MEKRYLSMFSSTRLLFIGNSFTNRNDLPGMLQKIAAMASPPRSLYTERIVANGMPLKAHLNKGEARAAIAGSMWDYVVLQEQSTLPLKNRQRMHESVRLFDTEIRAHHAKTVLYLTWARKHEFDRQTELTDAYTTIGHELGSIVVPVGIAWQRALKSHPDLILHDKDNSHPTLAGSYLAACVFFATLFGKGRMAADPTDIPKLAPKIATMLQDIAMKTVSDFSK
jgi:hypothetical protein